VKKSYFTKSTTVIICVSGSYEGNDPPPADSATKYILLLSLSSLELLLLSELDSEALASSVISFAALAGSILSTFFFIRRNVPFG
jgi:hypothetical protein